MDNFKSYDLSELQTLGSHRQKMLEYFMNEATCLKNWILWMTKKTKMEYNKILLFYPALL